MPVKVRCSSCEKVLNAPDKLRGKTVKCPKCESPLKIPSGKKKKSASESDPFGDDFLADLDLSRAEDHSQRVCPRCGAAVKEDDFDCSACGADLSSGGAPIPSGGGGKSPVGRKKNKGPRTSEFFKNTWGDAWRFLMNNKGYAFKTSMILLILNACLYGCLFMLVWCVNVPPRLFWLLLVFVFAMSPIGWVWHLATETIQHSLKKKDELSRVNFDFFTCVAYGIKFYVWQIVVGLPFLIVLGAPGNLMVRGGSPAGYALVGLSNLMILSLLPVGLTHMAMPQQKYGWFPTRVYAGWSKSLGGISYWLLILIISSLPVTATSGAAVGVFENGLRQFGEVMGKNAAVYTAREMKASAEKTEKELDPKIEAIAGQEIQELPWKNLTMPMILTGISLILAGPVIVYNVRIVGQIAYYYNDLWDLNTLEKQLKYTAKEVKYDKHGRPIDPNQKPAWMTAVIALVVIVVLFFVGNFIASKTVGKTFPAGLFGDS